MAGDPMEFLQRMFTELFDQAAGRGEASPGDTWRRATEPKPGAKEPSPAAQRENLAFALATRAVEALEDIALNTAAIRQLLRGTKAQPESRPGLGDEPRSD